MKQNNKKYFYSEIEDQIIVNSIREDFARRQEERRNYELTWELNLNFYLGNQYSYISSTGDISDVEKQYYWENREVFNHIAPIVEARLAKLSKIKPSLSIKPFSSSQEDVYSANLAKAVLQSGIDKLSLDNLVATANYWSEITGTAFYKVGWNSDLGDIVGVIDDKEVKNGDVSISVCSPFEIFPDSNNNVNMEDCESIIEAHAYPVSYVNEAWNTKLSGEDIDLFEVNSNSILSGMSGRSNITKVIHSKKHDHVLLIERYEKPSINHKNGRHTIICKDKLLYDGELEYMIGKNKQRAYPFVKQVSNKQVTSFWGSSIIERCIPLQRAYNAIKNKKHELISRLASGVLAVEDGSVDIDNLEEDGLAPGKILVYRVGSNPPKFLDAGSVPPEFDQEEEKLSTEMNSLASISDVTTSSVVPNNINSGSAISLLISQDESRLSLTAENIRQSIQKIGIFIIRLYKQFANELRLGKLNDSNSNIQLFYWNKSNLSSDDVIFDYDNELENSVDKAKETLLSLYEKGIFNDENGHVSASVKQKILEILGYEHIDFLSNMEELHKARAEKENQGIIPLEEPLEIDDHKIHINQHTKFLISDSAEILDKSKRTELLNHINSHKKFLEKNEV